jgi:hypothetical protein
MSRGQATSHVAFESPTKKFSQLHVDLAGPLPTSCVGPHPHHDGNRLFHPIGWGNTDEQHHRQQLRERPDQLLGLLFWDAGGHLFRQRTTVCGLLAANRQVYSTKK